MVRPRMDPVQLEDGPDYTNHIPPDPMEGRRTPGSMAAHSVPEDGNEVTGPIGTWQFRRPHYQPPVRCEFCEHVCQEHWRLEEVIATPPDLRNNLVVDPTPESVIGIRALCEFCAQLEMIRRVVGYQGIRHDARQRLTLTLSTIAIFLDCELPGP